MRRAKKSRTLSLLLVATALVPMVLITLFSAFTYTRNAEALETDKLQFMLANHSAEVEAFVTRYKNMAQSAARHNFSVKTLSDPFFVSSKDYLSSIVGDNQGDVYGVSIINRSGDTIASSMDAIAAEKPENSFFYNDFSSLTDKTIVTSAFDNAEGDSYFDIISPVYGEDSVYLGYICLTVSCDYFRQLSTNAGNLGSYQTVIMDSRGNACAKNIDEGLLSALIQSFWETFRKDENKVSEPESLTNYPYDGKTYTVSYDVTSGKNFYILCIMDKTAVLAGMGDYFRLFAALLLFTVLIIIFFHNLTEHLYAIPLAELVNTMKKVYDGDYSVRYLSDKNDEFGTLGKTFNVLVSKIQRETMIQNENAQIIEKLAFEDPLVNCRNLNKFMLDAEAILSRNLDTKYAVIQFDVNKFKMINEMFGYEEGNRVLKHISNVVSNNLNESELYARADNDNFVILMIYDESDELVSRMDTIITEAANVKDSNERYKLSFSVGIYKINDYNQGVKLMVNKAGMAQKTIKEKQDATDRIIFYDTNLRLTMIAEKVIENQMHVALENNEFVVYLQPKYNIVTNQIIGAEALVRWITSDGNLISPGQFIPLFEKNGFVVNVDFYVLETVCQLIREWLDNGLTPVRISVNQSRLHLSNPNYVSNVYKMIEKYGVPTEYIEFEITESAFMNDISSMMRVMTAFHSLGFHLSIDDFGSGFSSLNVLKELPFDVLKIDREFLNETSDSQRSKTVVIYVVSMAKKLEIDVICEGVETQAQADFLKEIGCYAIQGYFFSKPLPIKEFETLLFKTHTRHEISSNN